MNKKVLITDDHHLVRKGLQIVVQETLGFNTEIDFAENGKQAIEKIKKTAYDLLLTDLNMPETDEFGLISSILAVCPGLKILVITVKPEKVFAARFLKSGVLGYINKSEPNEVIAEAILAVSQGKRYISKAQAEIFSKVLIDNNQDSPFDKLSKREFEVTLLLLKGFGAIEVSNALSISASTASSFRCRIFEKLNIKNLIELNHLAQQYQVGLNFEDK